jgi:cell division septum initiation protein DivIVA
MAKSTQPASPPEEALDQLLDIVSNAREELVAVERRLEQLRADIAKSQKQRDGSSRKRRNLILKPAPSTPAAGQKKTKRTNSPKIFFVPIRRSIHTTF